MEICVCGQGEKSLKPDQIVLNITLSKVCKNNEQALLEGETIVSNFLNLMKKFGFENKDFKTTNYYIRDEVKYENGKSIKVGVKYTRGLKLCFDFDIAKMAKILEEASSLKDAPKICIDYALKDTKQVKAELFKDAYDDAKLQADMIASAAGLKVTKCNKATFNEEFGNFSARANYECDSIKMSKASASDMIAQTYTPSDIVVNQELYCIFTAE